MSDLLNQTDQAARYIRAGGAVTPSSTLAGIDTQAAAIRAAEQRKRDLMYGIPVSDGDFEIISQGILNSQNPDEERWNWGAALMYSQRLGIDLGTAKQNLEGLSKAWLNSPSGFSGKSHFEAVVDSYRVGDLQMQAAGLIKQWQDSGGKDEAAKSAIDGIYAEMEKLQDRFPRNFVIDVLKAGAQTAPFMGRVIGSAALAGGAATAAVSAAGTLAPTGGLSAPAAAPAIVGALKAAAFAAGSFTESFNIMRRLEYYEMRQMGVSHEIADPLSTVSGAAQATLETALGNVPGLIGTIGGKGINSIASGAARKLLLSGKMGAAASAITHYAGEIFEEGVEESFQSVASDLIKNIAAGLEGRGIPTKDAGEIAATAWEEFKGGALASVAMALPGSFIRYRKAARLSTALKDYAALTDRETFIERAAAWKGLSEMPEKERKAALGAIWEKTHAKMKEVRESEAAPAGSAKPFKRTEAGTLYTEEKTVDTAEEGEVQAILKVGDAETKERLGYLKYKVDEDRIVLEAAPFHKGYENLREEAIQELAAKYPGMEIVAEEGASPQVRAAVDSLAAANPRGTGANWFAEGDDQATVKARARLRLVLAEKMPRLSAVQRETAVLIHEFRANARGQAFGDYLSSEFSPEIIKPGVDRVSAAQGQRAGILFTSQGRELKIGEFVQDAKALILTTEKSDFVSFVHESGHLFRKQLIGTGLGNRLEEAYGILGGTWTREHEEQFAEDLVKYLSYGEVKDERLRSVFQNIADWIVRLWNRVLSHADVDPRVRAVMDELFASERSPLQEAAKTSVIAEDHEASADAKAVQPEGIEDNRDAYLFSEEGITKEREAQIKTQRTNFENWAQEYRNRYKSLPAEQQNMLSPVSGLPNRNAYLAKHETTPAPITVAVDADGLKFVNDDMGGHERGDHLLGAIGQTMLAATLHHDVQAYHLSGDEFILTGTDSETVEAALADIVSTLKSVIIDYEEDGLRIVLDGPEVSYGKVRGLDYAHADRKTENDKARKLLAGRRARREDIANNVRVYQNGRQLSRDDSRRILQSRRSEREQNAAKIDPTDPDNPVSLENRILSKKANTYNLFDNSTTLFQYIGERANLDETEKQNLTVARDMAKAGKDAETVRLATGWFKGKYDGKWRLEISDKAVAHVYEDRIIPGKATPLSEVLQYPELFAKYPELGSIPVSTLPEYTMADSIAAIGEGKAGEKHLLVTPERAGNHWELTKVVLHEVQHLVQEKEGFARGSSPLEFNFDERKLQAYRFYRDASTLHTMKSRAGSVEEAVKQFQARMGREPEPGSSTILDDYTKEELVQLAEDNRPRTTLEQYMYTAGEIEARDIETRMGLSPEQRRAIAPYSSEGIAAEDAVVLFQLDEATVKRLEGMEPVKLSPAAVPENYRDARKWILSRMEGMGIVRNEDSGHDVEIVKRAGREVSTHAAKKEVAAIVGSIPELIKRAIFLDEEGNAKPDRNPKLKYARHYAAFASLDGSDRLVTITTHVYEGKEYIDQLKDWQIEKKEERAAHRNNEYGASSPLSGALPHSNRIVRLLRDVKPDFLFEDDSGVDEMKHGEVLFQTSDPPGSPEFKAWFNGSKIVDENGKPLVMYRGSEHPNAEAREGNLIFLSPIEDFAKLYGRGNVFALFVRASKVFDAAGEDHETWKRFAEETRQPTYARQRSLKGALPFWTVQNALVTWLDENGIDYDGIYFAENDGSYSLAVKDIRQVKQIANTHPTEDPRILFQLDDEAIDAEAATFGSWEEWKDYVEGFAVSAFGEDARTPEGLTGEKADRWYRERWEAAGRKKEARTAEARTAERKEVRRGSFAAAMTKAGGVEGMLKAIWDAQVRAYDRTNAVDEREQAEIENAQRWKDELAMRLADHPLVLLTAQSVGDGKQLKPSTRRAILTYIRNNETEFAALYAELTNDLDLAQFAEAGRSKLQAIPDPKLERYADLSIAERTAILNRVTDKEVRAKIRSGAITDPEITDYIRRLEESRKKLEDEGTKAAEEIKRLGGELEVEEDYNRKLYARSQVDKADLRSAADEIEALQGFREKLETSRAAYAEALASARDESKLSVRLARKELLDLLRDARKEAALQSRAVAAEIRAVHRIRQQKDALRRAILKRPAKNIIWKTRTEIQTIQEYLRSKKWEYLDEQDDDGTPHRRRAYDTVIDEDGKKRKVPRFTTARAEGLKASLSMLLRETPGLAKLLTEGIVDRINEKPVTAWTVAELQELKKIIDGKAKEGKLAYQLKQAAEENDRSGARRATNETVRKSRYFKAPFGHGSAEQKELMKSMEKRSVLDLPFLNMRRFATVYMDGGKEGANTGLLVHEEREHYVDKVKEIDRRLKKVLARMRELGIKEKDFQEKVTIRGVGPAGTDYSITKGDLMAVRLAFRDPDAKAAFIFGNLFSEEERRSLGAETLKAQGERKYVTVSSAASSSLTPAMKEIADMIGEDFDKEFDRLNRAVIDLTNQEMKKVAHYFPIHREGVYFDKFNDKILEALKTQYGMTNLPDSGFTLERIKIGAAHQTPVKLDLFGTWQKAVERQEHLVAYGGYVKKLNAVYKSRKAGSVREAIIQSFGKAGMDYVDQYVSEVANPGEFKGPEEGDRSVRLLRGNMAVGFLAYRWTSVVKQVITSPLPYMAYAPRGTVAAAFQLLTSGNPAKWLEEIEGMSETLKHRTIDQIFQAIMNMDKTGFEGVVRKIGDTGMKGLEFADRFSVAIGWKGVYDEAVGKGMSPEEAVKQADDITLKTQPSARGVDLAPVFRGANEWKRLLLQFGSALNVVYQNIRYDIPQAVREKDIGRAIGIATSYAVAGLLLGAFAKAQGKDKPDDDEAWWRDWIFYATTQFSDSVPLIGNEITGFSKRWMAGGKRTFGDSELPAVQSMLEGMDQLFQGDLRSAAEGIGEGIGLGLGLPTLALKEYIEFLETSIGGEGE